MPEIDDLNAPAPVDLPGAPPWAQLMMAEIRAIAAAGARTAARVEEIAHATIGGGREIPHAEQLRDLQTRVGRIERWASAVIATLITVVGGAWAVANIHIGPRGPGGAP